MEAEYITVGEAQKRLGVSRDKMSRLMSDGELSFKINPIDKRKKYVLVSDVDALLQRWDTPPEKPKSRRKKPTPSTQG